MAIRADVSQVLVTFTNHDQTSETKEFIAAQSSSEFSEQCDTQSSLPPELPFFDGVCCDLFKKLSFLRDLRE